jgi:hypothetical protein
MAMEPALRQYQMLPYRRVLGSMTVPSLSNVFDAAQGQEEDTNNHLILGLVASLSALRYDHTLSVSDASSITHYVNS